MDYIAAASDMREKAWAELVASSAFRAFRAADNMVVELGGISVMPDLSPVHVSPPPTAYRVMVNPRPRIRVLNGQSKPTQTEAALAVLKELGPMGTKDVMDFSVERGATVGGAQPLVNFRTSLSKDDRFYSFRHNGEHLWWLTGVEFPEGFDEAANDLLRDAASSHSNQEGGDGHAANNTH